MIMVATDTGEVMPIPMTNSAAGRAGFTGISRVHGDHRDTQGSSFVFDEGSELVESPRMKACSLTLAMPCPPPNACEIFQDNDRIGVLGGKFHDAFANHMTDVTLKAGFSAGGVSERFLGALCPFALKSRSHSPVVMLALLDLATTTKDRMSIWPNGSGKIVHTKIYTDSRLGLFNRHLLNIGFEADMKIENPHSLAESSRGNGPSKVSRLLLTVDEGHLLALTGGADRDHAFFGHEAKITPALAPLQKNTTLETEGCLTFAVPTTSHCSISTGNLAFSRDGDLGSQPKPLTHIIVDSLVQRHVIGTVTHFMGLVADVVQRIAVCLHCLVKQCGLLYCRIQLQTSRSSNFHYDANCNTIAGNRQSQERRRGGSLPGPRTGVPAT